MAALGLAAGVLLVLLLFCLYRVLCPRNYGQNGVPHGRRRRGDLPCDDYGYSPPVSEISPLLLRGHSMVRLRWRRRSLCLSTKQTHKKGNTVHIYKEKIACVRFICALPLSLVFFIFFNNVNLYFRCILRPDLIYVVQINPVLMSSVAMTQIL